MRFGSANSWCIGRARTAAFFSTAMLAVAFSVEAADYDAAQPEFDAQKVIDAVSSLPEQKVTASDGAAGDFFGTSAAVSGDTAIIGAWRAAIAGHAAQGAVYVFTRTSSGWVQTQKIVASDGAAGDEFGSSVALSGDTLMVSAPLAKIGTNTWQGATYFFTRSGSVWTQQQKLTPSDGAAFGTFGDAVVMNANVALISAGGSSTGGVRVLGSVYAYNWVPSHTGGAWVQAQRVAAPDQTDQTAFFGASLALSGTQALAGARASTVGGNAGQGVVYVLAQNSGTWTVAAKLTANDGAARDNFGSSIALNGATAYIGSPGATIAGAVSQGALYRFTQSGATWTQAQKVVASDGAAYSLFGASVSQSVKTVMVGSYAFDNYVGRAYLFTANAAGALAQTDELAASDGVSGDVFGYYTALDPCTAIATSYTHDVGGHDEQGAAYFYSRICFGSP